jgi:predicted GIY-YIG superfamily endonuclease
MQTAAKLGGLYRLPAQPKSSWRTRHHRSGRLERFVARTSAEKIRFAAAHFSVTSALDWHSGVVAVQRDAQKGIESIVKDRQKILVGVAAVAVVLAGGGGIAAVHSFATSPQTPTVQGPEDDVPGYPDLPEPGDHPDGPGR